MQQLIKLHIYNFNSTEYIKYLKTPSKEFE